MAEARPETEAFLAVQRTADRLAAGVTRLLKPFDLSPAQYNVLRILRGAGPRGLACGEVAARMITRDPDVTRLVDRLERRDLLGRARETRDRRVVRIHITPAGLELLARLDAPVDQLHQRQFGHLGEQRLRELVELLSAARNGAE